MKLQTIRQFLRRGFQPWPLRPQWQRLRAIEHGIESGMGNGLRGYFAQTHQLLMRSTQLAIAVMAVLGAVTVATLSPTTLATTWQQEISVEGSAVAGSEVLPGLATEVPGVSDSSIRVSQATVVEDGDFTVHLGVTHVSVDTGDATLNTGTNNLNLLQDFSLVVTWLVPPNTSNNASIELDWDGSGRVDDATSATAPVTYSDVRVNRAAPPNPAPLWNITDSSGSPVNVLDGGLFLSPHISALFNLSGSSHVSVPGQSTAMYETSTVQVSVDEGGTTPVPYVVTRHTVRLQGSANQSGVFACALCSFPDLARVRLRTQGDLNTLPQYARTLFFTQYVGDVISEDTKLFSNFSDIHSVQPVGVASTMIRQEGVVVLSTAKPAQEVDLQLVSRQEPVQVPNRAVGTSAMLLAVVDGGGDGFATEISAISVDLLAVSRTRTIPWNDLADNVYGQNAHQFVLPPLRLDLLAYPNATGASNLGTAQVIATMNSPKIIISGNPLADSTSAVFSFSSPWSIADGETGYFDIEVTPTGQPGSLSNGDIVDQSLFRLSVDSDAAQLGSASSQWSTSTVTMTMSQMNVSATQTRLSLEPLDQGSAASTLLSGVYPNYAADIEFHSSTIPAVSALSMLLYGVDANNQLDLSTNFSSYSLPAGSYIESSVSGSQGHRRELYITSPTDGTLPPISVGNVGPSNLTISMDVVGSEFDFLSTEVRDASSVVTANDQLINGNTYAFTARYDLFALLNLSGGASPSKVYDLNAQVTNVRVEADLVCSPSCTAPSQYGGVNYDVLLPGDSGRSTGAIGTELVVTAEFFIPELSAGVLTAPLEIGVFAAVDSDRYGSSRISSATAIFTVNSDLVAPTVCDGDLDNTASNCLTEDSAQTRAYSAALMFSELGSDRAREDLPPTAVTSVASYWLAYQSGVCDGATAPSSAATLSTVQLSGDGGGGTINGLSAETDYCVFLGVRDAAGRPAYSSPVQLQTAAFSRADSDGDGLADDLEYDFMPDGGLAVCTNTSSTSSCDIDGDGLSDTLEAYLNNNAYDINGATASSDTDGDGIPDVVEVAYGRLDTVEPSAALRLPTQHARGALTAFSSFQDETGNLLGSTTSGVSVEEDAVLHVSNGRYLGSTSTSSVFEAANTAYYVSGTHWLSSRSAESIRRLDILPVLSFGGSISATLGGQVLLSIQLLGEQPTDDDVVNFSLSGIGLAGGSQSWIAWGSSETVVAFTLNGTDGAMATLSANSNARVSLCSFGVNCSTSSALSVNYQLHHEIQRRTTSIYAPVIRMWVGGVSVRSVADRNRSVSFSVSGSSENDSRTWQLSRSELLSSVPLNSSQTFAANVSFTVSSSELAGSGIQVYTVAATSSRDGTLQRSFIVGGADRDGDLIPDAFEEPGLEKVNYVLPYNQATQYLQTAHIQARLGDYAARQTAVASYQPNIHTNIEALGLPNAPGSVQDNVVMDVALHCGDRAHCFGQGDAILLTFSFDGPITSDKVYRYAGDCSAVSGETGESWCAFDDGSEDSSVVDTSTGTTTATTMVSDSIAFAERSNPCPAPGSSAYKPYSEAREGGAVLQCMELTIRDNGDNDADKAEGQLSAGPLVLATASGNQVVVFHNPGGGSTTGLWLLALILLSTLASRLLVGQPANSSAGSMGQQLRLTSRPMVNAVKEALRAVTSKTRMGVATTMAAALAIAALATVVMVSPATTYANDFSVGVSVGQSHLKPSVRDNALFVAHDKDPAFRVGLEYPLPFDLPLFVTTIEDLWLEGYWAHLGDADICSAEGCDGVEHTVGGLGVNWYPYGREQRWAPYISLGWRYGDAESNRWRVAVEDENGVYWAIGMEMDLAGRRNQGLALNMFYEHYDLGVGFGGVGLRYRFNSGADTVAAAPRHRPERRERPARRERPKATQREEVKKQQPAARRPAARTRTVAPLPVSPCLRPGASVCACLDSVRGNLGWYVQVAAYAGIGRAEAMAARLRGEALGARTRVGVAAVERRGVTLYAVRVSLDGTACGRAARIKRDIDGMLNVDSLVRPWFQYPW